MKRSWLLSRTTRSDRRSISGTAIAAPAVRGSARAPAAKAEAATKSRRVMGLVMSVSSVGSGGGVGRVEELADARRDLVRRQLGRREIGDEAVAWIDEEEGRAMVEAVLRHLPILVAHIM